MTNSIEATANQMMTMIEGRMSQYARSSLSRKPTVPYRRTVERDGNRRF